MILVCAFVLAAFLLLPFVPRLWIIIQDIRAYHQLAASREDVPVAYEEMPTRAALLLSQNEKPYVDLSPYDDTPIAGNALRSWDYFGAASSTPSAVIFAGELEAEDAKWFVVVHYFRDKRTAYSIAYMLRPPTLLRPPGLFGGAGRGVDVGKAPRDLRIYSGKQDPTDASHFTASFEFEGKKGTLHGWLSMEGSLPRVHMYLECDGIWADQGSDWWKPATVPDETENNIRSLFDQTPTGPEM